MCYLQFIYYPMKAIAPVYNYCFPPSCSQTPLCSVHVIAFGRTLNFFQKFILLFSLIQRHSNILMPVQLYEVMLISSDRCNACASQLFSSSISAFLESDLSIQLPCKRSILLKTPSFAWKNRIFLFVSSSSDAISWEFYVFI